MSRVPPEALPNEGALLWSDVARELAGMIESERYLLALLSQQPLLVPGASDRDAQRAKGLKRIKALEQVGGLVGGFIALAGAEAMAEKATAPVPYLTSPRPGRERAPCL